MCIFSFPPSSGSVSSASVPPSSPPPPPWSLDFRGGSSPGWRLVGQCASGRVLASCCPPPEAPMQGFRFLAGEEVVGLVLQRLSGTPDHRPQRGRRDGQLNRQGVQLLLLLALAVVTVTGGGLCHQSNQEEGSQSSDRRDGAARESMRSGRSYRRENVVFLHDLISSHIDSDASNTSAGHVTRLHPIHPLHLYPSYHLSIASLCSLRLRSSDHLSL